MCVCSDLGHASSGQSGHRTSAPEQEHSTARPSKKPQKNGRHESATITLPTQARALGLQRCTPVRRASASMASLDPSSVLPHAHAGQMTTKLRMVRRRAPPSMTVTVYKSRKTAGRGAGNESSKRGQGRTCLVKAGSQSIVSSRPPLRSLLDKTRSITIILNRGTVFESWQLRRSG